MNIKVQPSRLEMELSQSQELLWHYLMMATVARQRLLYHRVHMRVEAEEYMVMTAQAQLKML